MFKETNPILSDEFLEQLAKKISQEFGGDNFDETDEPINHK